MTNQLRKKIAQIVAQAKEGHIPSSFSIVDIIDYLYSEVLHFDAKNPKWDKRDYFVLSKGHGAAALYVVLHKNKFLTDQDLEQYSQTAGILGGHPDTTCVPGAEASTGSLGHGFPMAAGLALGLRIQNKENRIFSLLGDGECNEGTIWETALVAARQQLGNLTAIIDLNGSAAQILPVDPLAEKWEAFGWKVLVIDGHDRDELNRAFGGLNYSFRGNPKVIIAKTVKGKGVSFIEGHGKWHHRIPSSDELEQIYAELA
ncbi:MAG: Transketolase [Parachlamydiales bacterium]|nr:Transketolase [Parachlamydiales bacterium]